ncbi:NADP-dependent 3-hydroxy acid dehydrogenase YdfG [Monaibacterium marinum]|uniref:NADP-dependent 3-hydroxy acid dehydrogenase YdfG n=2 Tax=Pontivivens marinum TaxID=1690039 RepID=A0A2C9CVE6_9RHOB|nr:NADP-dependent 3-hydroxy acid dehydrogenase YdfG [Monaibacterium marinum]
MKNVKNKVVVITGASGGIGEATARHLASLGAKVVLGARRKEQLESIVADIRAASGEAEMAVTDVADAAQVKALVATAKQSFGHVDVMINNAGLMSIAPITETLVDEWDRMIDINIKGVLYGIAAALPEFTAQNSGHMITIGSIAGHKVSPGGAVYSGTKFAVAAISEGLRQEIGRAIRTTIIEPGLIDTNLKAGSSHEGSAAAIGEVYKMAISPSAIANAIAYAISQPADVDVNQIVLRPTVQDF